MALHIVNWNPYEGLNQGLMNMFSGWDRQNQQQQQTQDYQSMLQSSMQGMNSVPIGMQNLMNIQSPGIQNTLMQMLAKNLMPQQAELETINVGGRVGLFNPATGQTTITEMPYGTPQALQTKNIGENTAIFDPATGQIMPTPYPSSKVASTNVTLQNLPASTIKELTDYGDISDSIGSMRSILDQTKKYQGVGRQTLTSLQEKLPTIFGEAPEGILEFQTVRDNMSDILARMRTGAAINASEEKLYFKQFAPRLDLPYETNKRRLEQFDKIVQQKIKSTKKTYEELGYKTPSQQNVPPQAPNEIIVEDSKGNQFYLPKSQLQEAINQGYKEVK